jgi:hypothetical protein
LRFERGLTRELVDDATFFIVILASLSSSFRRRPESSFIVCINNRHGRAKDPAISSSRADTRVKPAYDETRYLDADVRRVDEWKETSNPKHEGRASDPAISPHLGDHIQNLSLERHAVKDFFSELRNAA